MCAGELRLPGLGIRVDLHVSCYSYGRDDFADAMRFRQMADQVRLRQLQESDWERLQHLHKGDDWRPSPKEVIRRLNTYGKLVPIMWTMMSDETK